MTTEAPDPKTFEAWGNAFQYPVPVVRRMEQQLRTDISSNKERLRTLVGYVYVPTPVNTLLMYFNGRASYRDLLGTADSIIEMDSQMHQVESYLATMGIKCNARLLERSGGNVLRLGQEACLKGAQSSTSPSEAKED